MALKDWKKQESIKSISYWVKFEYPFSTSLRVYKATEKIKALKKSYHGFWLVEVDKGMNVRGSFIKKFKKKSQALKFAKSYMRKH